MQSKTDFFLWKYSISDPGGQRYWVIAILAINILWKFINLAYLLAALGFWCAWDGFDFEIT
jgi:hypothetical protein